MAADCVPITQDLLMIRRIPMHGIISLTVRSEGDGEITDLSIEGGEITRNVVAGIV